MKKRAILLAGLVTSLLLPSRLLCQSYENVWYFGAHTGLDFRTQPPTLLRDGALDTFEGSATICDRNGKLLFYTDGVTVFNRKHQIMPNGQGLLGHQSSTHSAVILPDPGSADHYYIFTVNQTGYAGPNMGVNYSTVDMTLDGGLGDVSKKNINLADSTSEKIGAISACSDHSYWIIAHPLGSDEFYAWHLSEKGLDTNPVVSSTGVYLPEWSEIGWMALSAKSNLVALAHKTGGQLFGYGAEVCQIDPFSGSIKSIAGLAQGINHYGAAFSPSGKKVFFSRSGAIDYYNLTELDSSAIARSKKTLDVGGEATTLKLGPDGNIYVRSRAQLGYIEMVDQSARYVPLLYDLGDPAVGLPTHPSILPDSLFRLVVMLDTFTDISSCATAIRSLLITGSRCDRLLTGLEFSESSEVFTADTFGVFPKGLTASDTLRIPIHFNPVHRIGEFSAVITLIFTDVDGKVHRQLVNVSARSLPMPPEYTVTPSSVDFRSISSCFTEDTTIFIKNTGCDTLFITNIATSGQSFSFSSVSSPIRIAPGESTPIDIIFTPTSSGTHFGNVILSLIHQGISRSKEVLLSGSATAGQGTLQLLSTDTITIPDISICMNGVDTVVLLRNTGCKPVKIRDVITTGPLDYTIMGVPQNATVQPDSVLRLVINFAPQGKGVRRCLVRVAWASEDGANENDIYVSLTANVNDGVKVIASSLDTIDFGQTNICEERDSTMRFTNNGCDTLTITSADVDKNFKVGGTFPIEIAPGESIDVPVTTIVDTVGNPTVLTGNLTITSTADNTIGPITLRRQLYYPTKLRIEAVDEADGKAGDIAKFRIILDGEVPATMTALHFEFLHNNDLLSFEGNDGVGLSVTNTTGHDNQRQSFTLSPVHEGILGELSFKTYLASAEQTTLSFDHITFDAKGITFAPECIAVISDSGSRFNYIYTCGDNIIRDRLNGTRLIKSVTPNPAKEEIRVELNVPGPISYAMFDALGMEVKRGVSEQIDVTGLPSGVYYLRATAGGVVQSKRVVISR